MTDEFLLKLEAVALMRVQLDLSIARYCEEGPVRTKGVVRNWLMEEEVNFGGYHDDNGAL